MAGRVFSKVDFVGGHTAVGNFRVKVDLVDEPAALVVRKRGDNRGLFAIPWINVSRVEYLIVEKSFSGKFVTDIFGGQRTEEALKLICWDPEVQRDQTPMFALGNDRSRYPTLADYILNRRDEAMRGLNQATRPKR